MRRHTLSDFRTDIPAFDPPHPCSPNGNRPQTLDADTPIRVLKAAPPAQMIADDFRDMALASDAASRPELLPATSLPPTPLPPEFRPGVQRESLYL